MEGSWLILLVAILQAAVRSGTPILFVCIGEIYAERSGILNVGLEGLMLVGAIAGFTAGYTAGNPLVGIFAAAIAGALFSLIHAYVTITLRADQIVSGLTLTILGTGISGFFGKPMIGQVGVGFDQFAIPVLSKIPILGQVLFQQDAMVYLSFVFVPIAWWVMYKTHLGLAIRSVGENPSAADSLGVSVVRIRYGCVLFGGAMAGLGGAYLSLAYTTMWIEQMSGGRGWITLALVIFAAWNPGRAMLGAYLFGGADALQLRIQAVGIGIPTYFLMMLPYVLTIVILVLASRASLRRRIGAPAALGIPYAREER
ncbi:MAG: ABC transporter permease [Acidobacteriota bacterium]|nr:ABC transporter permease [Acidobacteriota bacterium]